ncbi:MAG: MtrB/PioB family outer membrane beta-barrel protein [Acidobacteriota bacterium]
MRRQTTHVGRLVGFLVAAALFSFPLASPAETLQEQQTTDENEVVVGVQGVSMDADQDRSAKFELNRDVPSGFVLERFLWSFSSEDGKSFVQARSRDAVQEDQLFSVRAGFANKVNLRVDWTRSPHRYGDRAVFVPGRVSASAYRFNDFSQQQLEDPDGNGVPFYLEPGGVGGDNALAANLMNQVLGGQNTFSLSTERETGSFALSITPSPEFNVNVDFSREWRDGLRAAGSGTYQRITDINGDGRTDFDYLFSLRGMEVPATVDYVTTRVSADANYSNGRWFGQAGVSLSSFDNDVLGITYDNPFWFTDTLATSGVRRGLWNEGRMSLPPSNDAWNLSFTGGVALEGNTQITATVSRGQLSQNDPFLPVTTNTALIGTVDVNGDGVIDPADDPTVASTLPRRSLDATVDTTVLGLRITSRPSRRVRLTGRFRLYDYDSGYDPFLVPYRAEYVESRLKPDFHGASLLHVPIDFRRTRFGADAELKASDTFKIVPFAERVLFDRDQYVDRDGGAFDRDAGFRAVPRTTENRFGVGLLFSPARDFGGRLTYRRADRDFEGAYQVGFSGELEEMRQFDVAKRERNTVDLQLDFLASRPASFSVGFRLSDDDYPDSVYGRQSGKEQGVNFNVNYGAGEKVNFFAFAEWSRMEIDSHLRTKCKNCKPPPGFDFKKPWGVPNFDWFSDYTDTTTAIGGGAVVGPDSGRYSLELQANYVLGNVGQLTRNPAPPLDLANPGNPVAQVALGVDFPDQESELFTGEVRFTRRLNDQVSLGLGYLVEVFNLSDFMWDPMQPYGRNYMEIDDYTRFLFLDSRYGDYTGQVVQAFLKVAF